MTIQRFGEGYGSVEPSEAGYFSSVHDGLVRLSGPDAKGQTELARPSYTALRGPRLSGRIWNDLCRAARLDRDAQASLHRGHEPTDGSNHGPLSDPLGLLRLIDCFATGHHLERDRGVGQLRQRRRIFLFRQQGKRPVKTTDC